MLSGKTQPGKLFLFFNHCRAAFRTFYIITRHSCLVRHTQLTFRAQATSSRAGTRSITAHPASASASSHTSSCSRSSSERTCSISTWHFNTSLLRDRNRSCRTLRLASPAPDTFLTDYSFIVFNFYGINRTYIYTSTASGTFVNIHFGYHDHFPFRN